MMGAAAPVTAGVAAGLALATTSAAGPLAPAADPLVAGTIDALRQTGAVETIRASMTPTLDAVGYAVTNLGDTWFLLVALTLFYWYGTDRDDGVLAVAIALGGLGLVTFLKHLFGLPRPPAELQAYAADSYGFPSGHALGSAVAWGAMAWLGDRWNRRHALAVAAPTVLAVGLSRVVLGVHYLGSVLAGFAIGLAFLAAMLRFTRDDPLWAFAVAAALAIGAAAAGALADGATAVGGALGGAAALYYVDVEGPVHPAAAVAALVGFGGLFAGALALEPPWPALLVVNAVVVAGLLSTPAMGRAVAARR